MKQISQVQSSTVERPCSLAVAGGSAFIGILFGLSPAAAFACACGCGVFDIGTASLFPSGSGGVAYLEYDYMNQNKNWSGTSSSASENNTDKQIRTQFYTAGVNYMFNHDWGVMVKVPYWNRDFTTDVGGGDIQTFNSKSVGDIRVESDVHRVFTRYVDRRYIRFEAPDG